jgi:hypothetical protein
LDYALIISSLPSGYGLPIIIAEGAAAGKPYHPGYLQTMLIILLAARGQLKYARRIAV